MYNVQNTHENRHPKFYYTCDGLLPCVAALATERWNAPSTLNDAHADVHSTAGT